MNNNSGQLHKSLEIAKNLIKDLGTELEETNRGLISLTLELENAKEKYKNIFENSREGIFQISADGKHFLLVNPSLVFILGYGSSEEIINHITNIPKQILVEPAQYPRLLLSLKNSKEDVIHTELQVRKHNGEIIWVSLILYEVSGKDKEILYYEGTMVDISDRKKIEQENEKLLEVFGKFVPLEFIHFLNHDHLTSVKLGDQVQEKLTVLFADIKSFTSISETMSSENNFNFLNAFLNRMGPCIRKHGGIIDKYIGDAVMALFPKEPENAVKAAIEMQQIIKNYNVERKEANIDPISFCIGMDYGNVRLGIIGDNERLQATAISDVVNQASRIEELAKKNNAPILVSEEVYHTVKDKKNLQIRQLGKQMIRGKKNPVGIYEVIDGDLSSMGEIKKKMKGTFEKGIHEFFEGRFAEASLKFKRVLKENPNDYAARIYLEKAVRNIIKDEERSNVEIP